MDFEYTLSETADEDLRQQILAPLRRYNEQQAGPTHHRPLAVTLRDAAGQVVGGLWGGTAFGWLFVQLLAVPEAARGRGAGTRLMDLAEQEARARGCRAAWLDTFEFQARGFYEKRGYRCFGELADYPPGHRRFFLQKDLA